MSCIEWKDKTDAFKKIDVRGIDGNQRRLSEGEAVLIPIGTPIGMRTAGGAVYTEISIRAHDV